MPTSSFVQFTKFCWTASRNDLGKIPMDRTWCIMQQTSCISFHIGLNSTSIIHACICIDKRLVHGFWLNCCFRHLVCQSIVLVLHLVQLLSHRFHQPWATSNVRWIDFPISYKKDKGQEQLACVSTDVCCNQEPLCRFGSHLPQPVLSAGKHPYK